MKSPVHQQMSSIKKLACGGCGCVAVIVAAHSSTINNFNNDEDTCYNVHYIKCQCVGFCGSRNCVLFSLVNSYGSGQPNEDKCIMEKYALLFYSMFNKARSV